MKEKITEWQNIKTKKCATISTFKDNDGKIGIFLQLDPDMKSFDNITTLEVNGCEGASALVIALKLIELQYDKLDQNNKYIQKGLNITHLESQELLFLLNTFNYALHFHFSENHSAVSVSCYDINTRNVKTLFSSITENAKPKNIVEEADFIRELLFNLVMPYSEIIDNKPKFIINDENFELYKKFASGDGYKKPKCIDLIDFANKDNPSANQANNQPGSNNI